VDRGEEIVYCSTEPFAEKVRRTGARFRPYGTPFLADMRRLPDRMDELVWQLMLTTADVLARDLEGLRAEAPDYLITDATAPWGQWLGELLEVPVVTSVSTFAFNRQVLAFGMSRGVRPKSLRLLLSKLRYIGKSLVLGRTLRRRYRVHGPDTFSMMFGHSDLNVVYTSRQFQPRAETFDDRFLFVGPSIAPRHEPSFLWSEHDRRPIVYISLGTIFNTDATFYRTCLTALGTQDVHVIMSVGATVLPSELGDVPANVTIQSYVPQLEVLERAAVFVTHGGMNSVSESLHYGMPMVVIPQIGEQAIVGLQLQALGAGILLQPEAATAPALRASVRQLLADPAFREKAVLLRDSFEAAGGVARAAEAIISHTRGRVPVSSFRPR
jgi:MGT family glycosyltransferase